MAARVPGSIAAKRQSHANTVTRPAESSNKDGRMLSGAPPWGKNDGQDSPVRRQAQERTPPLSKHRKAREGRARYDCTLWQAESADRLRWQHCVAPFGKV